MIVLLVNGSPNADGNTAAALRAVQDVLQNRGIETEWFQLSRQPVRGCIDCGGCRGTNRCAFNDDQCNALRDGIMSADAVIIGNPVYFAAPNGALCALLDRVFYSTCTFSQLFKGKAASALVTCAGVGGTSALDRLHRYFVPCQMPVIDSCDYLSFQGSCVKDKNPRAMELLETLGSNMADFLTAQK